MTNYSEGSVLSMATTTCGVVYVEKTITNPTKEPITLRYSHPLVGWATVVDSIDHERNGDGDLERVHDTYQAPVVVDEDGYPWTLLGHAHYRVDPAAPWSPLAPTTRTFRGVTEVKTPEGRWAPLTAETPDA